MKWRLWLLKRRTFRLGGLSNDWLACDGVNKKRSSDHFVAGVGHSRTGVGAAVLATARLNRLTSVELAAH